MPDQSYSNSELALNHRALHAAQAAVKRAGVSGTPALIRVRGVFSWIYIVESLPRVVIKLAREEDLHEAHKRMEEIQVMRRLEEIGAPLPHFIDTPMLEDGFIVTVMEYMPNHINATRQDLYDYGRALAELRNVSVQHPDLTARALPFDPLADMQRMAPYFQKYQAQTGITQDFVNQVYLPRLKEGQAAVQKMLAICEERGYGQAIIQSDVTLSNALRDQNGRTILIDFDEVMQGPDEFALGRPLGQWESNFGRPAAWGQYMREGYEATTERPLDTDLLALALLVSRIKFAISPLRQMLDAIRQGHRPDRWTSKEGTKRLENIDVEGHKWLSQYDYVDKKVH
jgi:Ser/Thr protein kinase RdoA (MazF antagonist)